MLEVCFSDSVKAAIRIAQVVDKNSIIGGASSVAIIGRSRLWMLLHPFRVKREKMRYERERRDLMELIEPIGGGAGDIARLGFMLDIGDISGDIAAVDSPRKKVIQDWLTADPWGELPEMQAEAEAYWQSNIEDLALLKARISAGDDIRIWADDSPEALCGLMHAASLIAGSGCRVILANAPKSFIRPDGVLIEYRGWSEIPPELYGRFASTADALSADEIKAFADGWRILKKQNAPLRVMENKKIKSAKADAYDGTILSFLEGSMKVGELIGTVLGKGALLTGDWLIALRIKSHIESGKILLQREDPGRFYGSIIKKA